MRKKVKTKYLLFAILSLVLENETFCRNLGHKLHAENDVINNLFFVYSKQNLAQYTDNNNRVSISGIVRSELHASSITHPINGNFPI